MIFFPFVCSLSHLQQIESTSGLSPFGDGRAKVSTDLNMTIPRENGPEFLSAPGAAAAGSRVSETQPCKRVFLLKCYEVTTGLGKTSVALLRVTDSHCFTLKGLFLHIYTQPSGISSTGSNQGTLCPLTDLT